MLGEFLRPHIEGVKIIQYENEAIIEIRGQQLWFVHSIELSLIIKLDNPVEVKELSICFRTNMDKIPGDLKENEVILLSYFCNPIQQIVEIKIEVNEAIILVYNNAS